MTTELVPLNPIAGPLAVGTVDVLAAFLDGRNPRTLRAYDRDLTDFARYLGQANARAAVELLLTLPHGRANAVALGYRAHLVGRGLKAATIGRRLAALRSFVKLARTIGRIVWTLDVESPKAKPYRDTTGPGDAGWSAMLAEAKAAAEGGIVKARRDLAIVRLLHDVALRRGELVALDLADVDLTDGTIAIIGKGETDAVRLTLPEPTRRVLADWIQSRGIEAGPLFVRLDRAAREPTRLTGTAVFLIVRDLGRRVGLSRPTRPHALRHQAITKALEVTGGNVPDAMRFSRHADPRTLMIYNDRRNDVASDVAELVAGV